MSNQPTTRILWIAAVVLLFAGVVMTARNLGSAAEATDRVAKLVGSVRVLRNMAADLERYESARLKMEKLPEKHPVHLAGIIAELLPGIKVDEIKDTRKDSASGWVVRQKEIALNDVPVGKAMEFVKKAESGRLPWRLARCTIRSAPRVAGTAQVVLLLEAVDRVE